MGVSRQRTKFPSSFPHALVYTSVKGMAHIRDVSSHRKISGLKICLHISKLLIKSDSFHIKQSSLTGVCGKPSPGHTLRLYLEFVLFHTQLRRKPRAAITLMEEISNLKILG